MRHRQRPPRLLGCRAGGRAEFLHVEHESTVATNSDHCRFRSCHPRPEGRRVTPAQGALESRREKGPWLVNQKEQPACVAMGHEEERRAPQYTTRLEDVPVVKA